MSHLLMLERTDPYILFRKENREDVGRLLAEFGRGLGDDNDFRQIGVWLRVGMTGKWPLCLGLYELQRGWHTFENLCNQTMRAPEPALAASYEQLQYRRTGGTTMILRAADGSPSFEEMIAAPELGHMLILEEAQVEPGAEDEYLGALNSYETARRAKHGIRLLGLFAGTTVEGFTTAVWQTSSSAYAESRIEGPPAAWLEFARPRRSGWREEIWIAAPTSRFAALAPQP